MRRSTIATLLLASTLLLAGLASARRLPAPGGEVVVGLPRTLRGVAEEAHSTLPVLEPVPRRVAAAELLARPALPGWPEWRSLVLRELRPAEGGRVWQLETAISGEVLADGLRRCLGPDRWPGRALLAAGVSATVSVGQSTIDIAFERPVGPVAELLAGCVVEAAGPFGPADETGRLRARQEAGPLLDSIVLADPLADADVAAGDPGRPAATSLATRAPDVLLFLQATEARDTDPAGLRSGPAALRELLAPELLLAVFWGGRGSPTDGILPPGLAPGRPLPLPSPSGPDRLDLSIESLPADAPRLEVTHDTADALTVGTVERLAVILRSRGWRLGEDPVQRAEVLRWRPPTLDPALALLALAGSRPDLLADERLHDPALLDPDPDRRMATLLTVEAAWIQERRVTPLMTADRWIVHDPDLRGVRLRPDGIPLLHEAWWTVPR